MEAVAVAVEKDDVEALNNAINHLPSVKEINYTENCIPVLYKAARGNKLRTLEFLLRNGANTSVREPSRNSTPLHGAAWGGNKEAVELLLRYGANSYATNASNDTPLEDSKTEEIRNVILIYRNKIKEISNELISNTGKETSSRKITINRNGKRTVRVVCISDTHNFRSYSLANIPQGDILVHSGDFTDRGTVEELNHFKTLLDSLPHPNKIVVAGNHDYNLDDKLPERVQQFFGSSCVYLQDSSIEILGIKFYGTPWTPIGMSFHSRGESLTAMFDRIPDDTDFLITHSPPYNVLDLAYTRPTPLNQETTQCKDCNLKHPQYYKHWGVKSLKNRVLQVNPKVHQFGHVHDDGGKIHTIPGFDTYFVNAAVDLYHKPIVLELIV